MLPVNVKAIECVSPYLELGTKKTVSYEEKVMSHM